LLPTCPNHNNKWELDGCANNIRIYKYSKSQRFGKHYDESNDIGPNKRTFFTVLVYLNGNGGKTLEENDFLHEGAAAVAASSAATTATAHRADKDILREKKTYSNNILGGETQFFLGHKQADPICSMDPLQGSLLFHEHGERCLLHQGAVVLQGDKYILRTDVVYRRCK
jgi:hypothetical protein